MKSPGYTREELFKEFSRYDCRIKRDEEMPIGYCFSLSSRIRTQWRRQIVTLDKKESTLKKMVGQLVGKPLLDYLNEHCKNQIYRY